MVNVEIHGLDQDSALEIRRQILGIFRVDPPAATFFVTIFPTIVAEKDGHASSFLRLMDNLGQTKAQQIIKVLKTLAPHVEHVRLEVDDQ